MGIPIGTDDIFADITSSKRDAKALEFELLCPAEYTRDIDEARGFFTRPNPPIIIDYKTNQDDKTIPAGETWTIKFSCYICSIKSEDAHMDMTTFII